MIYNIIKEKTKLLKNTTALSIIEVLVALSVFATIGATITFIVIDSYGTQAQSEDLTIATQFGNEAIQGVLAIKEEDWGLLNSQTGSGSLGLKDTNGYFEIDSEPDTLLKYSRIFTINEVYRSSDTGDIVDQTDINAVLDESTLRIDVNVSWQEPRAEQITISEYVSEWAIKEWSEDSIADFSDGTFTNTLVSDVSGDGNGAVTLAQTNSGTVTYQCIGNTVFTYDLPGNNDAQTITGYDNYIFFAQSSTIYSYDVTDVSNPLELDSVNVSSKANTMIIEGNYIYATTGSNPRELEIIDVSDPTNLLNVGEFNAPGNSDGQDIAVVGNIGYLVTDDNTTNGRNEFYVLDLTDRTNPTLISSLEINSDVLGVTVVGNYAYLATTDPTNEFKIVDISNSASPQLITQFDLPGSLILTDIAFFNDHIFVSTGNFVGDIYSINVSNVLAPTIAHTITESGANHYRLRVFGGYLFVGSENLNDELFIYLINDPANPIKQTSKEYGDTVLDVYVSGQDIFISSNSNGAEFGAYVAVDIDSWSCPEQLGGFDIAGTANAERIIVRNQGADKIAFVVRGFGTDNQLHIYNVNNPENGVLLGSISVTSQINEFRLLGNYAYLVTSDDNAEIKVIDVTDLTTPTLVSSLDLPGAEDAVDIRVSGARAYVSRIDSATEEFIIINISDPLNISQVSATSVFEIGQNVDAIEIQGNHAFIGNASNNSELVVLDITDESNITQVTQLNVTDTADLSFLYINPLNPNYLFGSFSTSYTVRIFDISNPASPTEVSNYTTDNEINSFVTNGNYLYAVTSSSQNELQIFDITDIANPSKLATFDNNFSPVNDIFLFDDLIYLANSLDTQEVAIIGRKTIGGVPGIYETAGSYISNEFNTSSTINLQNIYWSEVIPAGCVGCSIQIQLRTAPDNGGVPGSWTAWAGETGFGSYFTNSTGGTVTPDLDGNTWIQYRVEFVGDSSYTPVLNNINILF